MPRNEMTIKKKCGRIYYKLQDLEPLRNDVHFQNIIKRLKTLEEKY